MLVSLTLLTLSLASLIHSEIACPNPHSSLSCYWQTRAQLAETEAAFGLGYGIHLTPQEEQVDKALSQMKQQLRDRWPLFPSLNFRSIMSDLAETDLYKKIYTMPKGAILHLHNIHFPAFAVAHGTYRTDCWVNPTEQAFRYATQSPGAEWTQTVAWRAKWPKGERDFDEYLWNMTQFYTPPIDISETDMWIDFDARIGSLNTLVSLPQVWNASFLHSLDQLAKQNIQHVEMRTGVNRLPSRIPIVQDLLRSWNQKNAEKAISFLWIAETDRARNHSVVLDHMKKTLEFQANPEYGKSILGFDLVDEEDRFHKLSYYAQQFVDIQEYAAQQKLPPLQYYFHCGETEYNWHNTSNLYDAIMLQTKRIGHGLALRDHPLLRELTKAEDIAIEVCPISNQLLRNVGDLRTHPAVAMIREGMKITLSPDDPSNYGYIGNTFDFVEAILAWDLNLNEVKQIAWNSILYSGLSPTEKTAQLVTLQSKWKDWISRF